ncbi:hypothetical protein DFS34DRAFT_627500 [Phlyctochytrium arcticum]|nr:hypothetical protein DFS34DRAFT_627500 [Phlyctochytrium arcticum]
MVVKRSADKTGHAKATMRENPPSDRSDATSRLNPLEGTKPLAPQLAMGARGPPLGKQDLKSDPPRGTNPSTLLGHLPALNKRPLGEIINHGGLENSSSKSANASTPAVVLDGKRNLNQLDNGELQKVKESMDVEFERNRIAKGDKDFVYDVRKNFGPAEEDNDWDEDSEVVPQVMSKPSGVTPSSTKQGPPGRDSVPLPTSGKQMPVSRQKDFSNDRGTDSDAQSLSDDEYLAQLSEEEVAVPTRLATKPTAAVTAKTVKEASSQLPKLNAAAPQHGWPPHDDETSSDQEDPQSEDSSAKIENNATADTPDENYHRRRVSVASRHATQLYADSTDDLTVRKKGGLRGVGEESEEDEESTHEPGGLVNKERPLPPGIGPLPTLKPSQAKATPLPPLLSLVKTSLRPNSLPDLTAAHAPQGPKDDLSDPLSEPRSANLDAMLGILSDEEEGHRPVSSQSIDGSGSGGRGSLVGPAGDTNRSVPTQPSSHFKQEPLTEKIHPVVTTKAPVVSATTPGPVSTLSTGPSPLQSKLPMGLEDQKKRMEVEDDIVEEIISDDFDLDGSEQESDDNLSDILPVRKSAEGPTPIVTQVQSIDNKKVTESSLSSSIPKPTVPSINVTTRPAVKASLPPPSALPSLHPASQPSQGNTLKDLPSLTKGPTKAPESTLNPGSAWLKGHDVYFKKEKADSEDEDDDDLGIDDVLGLDDDDDDDDGKSAQIDREGKAPAPLKMSEPISGETKKDISPVPAAATAAKWLKSTLPDTRNLPSINSSTTTPAATKLVPDMVNPTNTKSALPLSAKAKEEPEVYSDDFGAGHTDEEDIVFSDDGLSFDDGGSDGGF